MSRSTNGTFFLNPPVTVKEFQKKFEKIAPPAIAWKGDNVGLQIGRESDIITNILVALDMTMDIAVEAKKKKANLIIVHHPLLFHPLKNITPGSRVGEIVLYLTEQRINLYAAHTNLDSVKWGVNFVLAKMLTVKNLSVLSPLKESLTKVVVFVPLQHVERVAESMHDAGAGTFSKYDTCSFRTEGTGTFRGMRDAQPFLGEVGKLERAQEIRLEMLCETWKINAVLSAMMKAHPYEEVAYDIYPLSNKNTEYGLGAIGDLERPLTEKQFLAMAKKRLGVPAFRFSKGPKTIQRVAVCGGSGSELINDAVNRGADAMITADIKYHTFQEFEGRILLIDAGHYETEHHVLPAVKDSIKKITEKKKSSAKIFMTEHSTNPIHYFL
ncbi:MAG: Nif3-like dinuclear metal center hexameric protein [Ignavibacteriales bacterium]|nr:Nif3-like dinuclear metal center hexameric protein [Ignavibacteriales bacterium]